MKKSTKLFLTAVLGLASLCTMFADGKTMKDCVSMKDGKMSVTKGGESTPMQSDVAMSNGTVVTPDGAVTTKSGEKKMLKDGDHMSMDGEMMKMEDGPHGKHDSKDKDKSEGMKKDMPMKDGM